jgi:hypothetical protein
MRRQGIERTRETDPIRLVLTFQSLGVREIREASRIGLDGNGGLVVYDGDRQERLLFSRISRLRIVPVPPPVARLKPLPENVALLA